VGDAGLPAALERLGALYVEGVPGVTEPDDARALRWYRKAAALPELRAAQQTLARRLETGSWRDPSESAGRTPGAACRFLRLGCAQTPALPAGPDPEVDFLAWLRSQSPGRGSTAELAEAFALYRSLAQRGDALAAERLGYMLTAGHGTAANRFDAFRWFLAAARRDSSSAQYIAGKLYLLGEGYARNADAGTCWLSRASTSSENARRALAALRAGAPAQDELRVPERCDFPPSD
jgi:TPR repeat protein